MPVSTINNNYPVVGPLAPRSGAAERGVQDDQRRVQQADNNPSRREPGDSRTESSTAYPQRQVLYAQRPVDVVSRPQAQDNLDFNTQRALRAFADNTPSPEQRLGIELAGIDTYA